MSKLSIAIAIAGASLTTAVLYALKSHVHKNRCLTKQLIELRDDLELNCDLIDSAVTEIPEETITVADRQFKEIVDEAADFTTTTFRVYAYLDDDEIDKLSPDAKRAYIECFGSIIQYAERYVRAINAAREDMLEARRKLSIE
jgi:hypothetical protein